MTKLCPCDAHTPKAMRRPKGLTNYQLARKLQSLQNQLVAESKHILCFRKAPLRSLARQVNELAEQLDYKVTPKYDR